MQKMNAELGIGKFTERHVEHYLQRFDTDQDKLLSQEEWPGSIRPVGNGADGRVWRNGGAGPVVLANLCKVSHFFFKRDVPRRDRHQRTWQVPRALSGPAHGEA